MQDEEWDSPFSSVRPDRPVVCDITLQRSSEVRLDLQGIQGVFPISVDDDFPFFTLQRGLLARRADGGRFRGRVGGR